MRINWFPQLLAVLCYNVVVLLVSLVVFALISCNYRRKPKEPLFTDENDPRSKTLYNIKTEIAFPKRIPEEIYRSSMKDINAISWSLEYEKNAPLSALSSSPLPESLHIGSCPKPKKNGEPEMSPLLDHQCRLGTQPSYDLNETMQHNFNGTSVLTRESVKQRGIDQTA